MTTPRILIIAGSDSGGGAGIQADIKTVTMLGGHAMTAITAITAQNTLGVVQAVMPVPAEMVVAQINFGGQATSASDAVKIGMIGSAETGAWRWPAGLEEPGRDSDRVRPGDGRDERGLGPGRCGDRCRAFDRTDAERRPSVTPNAARARGALGGDGRRILRDDRRGGRRLVAQVRNRRPWRGQRASSPGEELGRRARRRRGA